MCPRVTLTPDEVEFRAIRAQGADGQSVIEVSSAVHLRFEITASSQAKAIRERLLQLGDQLISKDSGVSTF